jgi:hypothetical protein
MVKAQNFNFASNNTQRLDFRADYSLLLYWIHMFRQKITISTDNLFTYRVKIFKDQLPLIFHCKKRDPLLNFNTEVNSDVVHFWWYAGSLGGYVVTVMVLCVRYGTSVCVCMSVQLVVCGNGLCCLRAGHSIAGPIKLAMSKSVLEERKSAMLLI